LNANTCALARMNMILHGIDNARIELGDTLKCPKLVNDNSLMKFDVVLANPPFSFNIWGAENAEADRYARFWRGVPPKSKGDYAFISHMVEVAKARKGRVAVVVPHGVLFRGAAEGRIRQKLVEENLLDAVIGLPQNLFPTTSIPVAILVFDRSREHGGANESRTDVVFIDASREFQPGKYQNALLDEHVDNIVVAYRSRKNMAKFVRAVSIREIGENDFNLNIPNYVNSLEGDEETDVTNVQKEIEELEIELAEVRAKMRKYPRELGDNT
jgi:type I restriction enzyme M protein